MNATLPIQSASHKKEKLSELEFKKMMMDWIVFSFKEVDYGIDSIVEITHPRLGTNDDEVTNMKFSVQLKSTQKFDIKKGNIAFSGVPLEKINYWCRGNLPTLFVAYDIDLQQFFFRWIDMELINELDKKHSGWRTQKTTTIDIPAKNILAKSEFSNIADYVNNYKRSYKRIIPSGTFFNLKKDVLTILSCLQQINGKHSFDSVTKQTGEISDQLDKAMYKITITGQTKAGKSSLINAILHRYISTEDFLPLTGIPINFIPGREEYSEIIFNDGKKLKGTVEESFLKKYISKNENKGNTLGVSVVNVVIINHQLENGVSLSDVPGIDDMEERIQTYTWSTLDQSNAILYVVDAMPYEGGGQVFSYTIMKDLKKLEQTKGIDKIFILFNKVDYIKSKPISKLKKHIAETFEEHGINKIVHSKIFYISAKESFKLRTGKLKRGTDKLVEVEQELWTFILNENKIGVYKLQKLLSEIDIQCNNYSSLSNLALSEDVSFKQLKSSIEKAQANFPSIKNSLNEKRGELKMKISNYITRRNEDIIAATKRWLDNSERLPAIDSVRQYLVREANVTMKSSNEYLAKELLLSKNDVDLWVEENLNKIRSNISDNTQYQVDLSNLNSFVVQNLTDFHVAMGLINFGVLAVIALEFPPVAIFLGILSLLGWVSTADDRRRKNINTIIDAVRENNTIASTKITEKYDELIAKNVSNLYKYGQDRLNLFIDDIEKEIKKKGVKPISFEARTILENNLKQILTLKSDIEELDRKIKLEFF